MESAEWQKQLGRELFGADFEFAHFPVKDSGRRGLLGYTADITPSLVFSAYLQGIFPWYNEDEGDPVLWWCPDPRFVLPVDELHIPHSIDRFLKHTPYTYTMDKAFSDVIKGCASMKRPGQEGTWIGRQMLDVYKNLAARGIAHSVEVWHNGRLAGGLYGILVGQVFCGESMFTVENNSSKSAFVLFSRAFKKCGGRLIDSQVYTDNIARYGAHNISRTAFLHMESQLLAGTLCRNLRETFEESANTLI
ncbi:MAG: leucyl/phenylalanyl-tRNA--protein transferase [Treponema sp.]